MERLELSQDNLLEPKSSASTSSATFAFCMNAALYVLIGYLTSYILKIYNQTFIDTSKLKLGSPRIKRYGLSKEQYSVSAIITPYVVIGF